MNSKHLASLACICLALGGCSTAFWGGAAAGAVGTGAVYEHRNRQARDDLEKAFERGEISKEDYLRRKKELDRTSILD